AADGTDTDHDDHHLDDLDSCGEERGGEDCGADHGDVSLPSRLAPVWNRVLPPSAGRFRGVWRDVLAQPMQLFGERGERAEARSLAEGSAGLLQRIEPFVDDLPGRVLV